MEDSEKENVLVVDDDSTNLMMTQKILGSQYRLAAAKSGEKALKYLETHMPALILMDINMPDMDGFETVRIIKSDEKFKDIPIIFLTADRDSETEKKCFDVGAVDYVSKPFVADVLLSRVSRSLELEKHKKNLEGLVADRTRELVEALRVKSDFLANMSHEIRTPMNAVLGMAEMALREEMTPSARDYIHQIRASGKNLLVIINDILDFSKIESGKMEIVPVTYDLLSMINDISGIICSRIGDRELEFIMDVSPDIPAKLIGDNVRIQQIMINLLGNAVKFTKIGQVMLRLCCERLDDENIIMKGEVIDTGIGIKEEDIPKLFGIFKQLDSKRNRNVEGTGLGLKISKQLIELMEGTISVESVYEQGSKFFFELPQKIADNSSLLPDNIKSDITVGLLIYNNYVKAHIITELERIGAEIIYFSSSDTVFGSNGHDIDFLITEKSLYTEELNDFFKDNDSGKKCIVIDTYESKEDIINPNVILLRKPVYFLNLYAALGIIREYKRDDGEDEDIMPFIAPDAQVLIVDDNNVNLTVAKGLLSPLKMKVDTAESGSSAIEHVKQKKYDIIFMDHMMPEMDGVEATHIIRQLITGNEKVPIIALTANALAETRDMMLKEGMNDFVAKPVGTKEITEKVHRWLPPEKISYVESGASEESDNDAELAIDGLNVENALSLLGSKELYLTVLKDYFLSIDKKSALIREYYEDNKWRDYTIEVHSLKSTSRQIGADELAELAYELELAGKSGHIGLIQEKTDKMLEMYIEIKQLLIPLFPEYSEKHEKSSASVELITALLDELSEALESFDTLGIDDAIEKMSRYQLNEKQSKFLELLVQASAEFDIDRMNRILSDWRSDIAA